MTTNVVSSNPTQTRCTDTTLCDSVCQWSRAGRWFFPVFSTYITDHHEKVEALLKVALNTITQTHPYCHVVYSQNVYTERQKGFEFSIASIAEVYNNAEGLCVPLYIISTCTVYRINNADIWSDIYQEYNIDLWKLV